LNSGHSTTWWTPPALLWVGNFLRWGFKNYLPRLALNCLSSWSLPPE
jgi:hypothetical protein